MTQKKTSLNTANKTAKTTKKAPVKTAGPKPESVSVSKVPSGTKVAVAPKMANKPTATKGSATVKKPLQKSTVAKNAAVPKKNAVSAGKSASDKVAQTKKISSAKSQAVKKTGVKKVAAKAVPAKKSTAGTTVKATAKQKLLPKKAVTRVKREEVQKNVVKKMKQVISEKEARSAAVIAKKNSEGKLTKTELKKFRSDLAALRESVSKNVKTARQNVKHHNESNSMSDSGAHGFDKFLTYERAGNVNDLLVRIDEAIARIDEGTYGKCLICGGAIRRVRLEVQPFSKHCIKCQEAIEKGLIQ